jgi:HAD superfamily hydrolase (TIGR01490 family)
MALAIFDLDNTLIAGDSDYLWGKFLIEKGVVDPDFFEAENERFYADYQKGTLDIMEYQKFSLAPLTKERMATLRHWHEQFMEKYIKPIYLPKAQVLVDEHRAKGDTLLVITATNTFVTKPIAKLYGINNIIGTDPEIIDCKFTGNVKGTPSFQEGKVIRLKEWLKDHHETLQGSTFYSDSHNDIPLLEVVDHPVAVDPDPKLAKYALKHGWKQISLR